LLLCDTDSLLGSTAVSHTQTDFPFQKLSGNLQHPRPTSFAHHHIAMLPHTLRHCQLRKLRRHRRRRPWRSHTTTTTTYLNTVQLTANNTSVCLFLTCRSLHRSHQAEADAAFGHSHLVAEFTSRASRWCVCVCGRESERVFQGLVSPGLIWSTNRLVTRQVGYSRLLLPPPLLVFLPFRPIANIQYYHHPGYIPIQW